MSCSLLPHFSCVVTCSCYGTDECEAPLLLNPQCHRLSLFSPLTPPHPSAHSHPAALCPDMLPSQTGNSRRQRPCLGLPLPLAQDIAPSQLSGTGKIQVNESGQRVREAGGMRSWPACQQIRCLQSGLGCSKESTLGPSPPLPGLPVSVPAALLLGTPNNGVLLRPSSTQPAASLCMPRAHEREGSPAPGACSSCLVN